MKVIIGKSTYTAERADIDIKICTNVIRAHVELDGKCEKMIVAGDFDVDCRNSDSEKHVVIAGIVYRLVFERGVLYTKEGTRKLVPLHTYDKTQVNDPTKIYQVNINGRNLVTVDESAVPLKYIAAFVIFVIIFFMWFNIATISANAVRFNDIARVLSYCKTIAVINTIFGVFAMALTLA